MSACIVMMGESGSGKTENGKAALEYISHVASPLFGTIPNDNPKSRKIPMKFLGTVHPNSSIRARDNRDVEVSSFL